MSQMIQTESTLVMAFLSAASELEKVIYNALCQYPYNHSLLQ